MNQHSITNLPVVESEDVCSVKESSEEVKELLESENTALGNQTSTSHLVDSSENLGENSGRVMFRGQEMAFLIVNGIQMFTLYEIMTKLCPETKRGTVGYRFTRLNATRHACNREEIMKIKELGGTNQKLYNCTLVAREDVERYCEKYGNENGAPKKTRSSNLDNEELGKCTVWLESMDMDDVQAEQGSKDLSLDISTVSNFRGDVGVEERNADNNTKDMTSNNNIKVDKEGSTTRPKQDTVKRKKGRDTAGDHTKANKTKQKQIKNEKNKPKGNARKPSKSVLSLKFWSKCLEIPKESHKIAQEVFTVDRTNTSNLKTQDGYKSNNLLSPKRKRRTQFEMLQSYQFYTAVGHEDLKNESKDTSVNHIDNQSLTDDQQLKADSPTSDIIDGQYRSSEQFLWQGIELDDHDKLDLPHLDINNNISEPRSPTLLLKRSQNNKWRVASQVLPQISFEDIDSETNPEREIEGTTTKKPGESKKVTEMTKVKDKQKVVRKRKSSDTTAVNPSNKKMKVEEDLRLSKKKRGKKYSEKVNQPKKINKISAATLRQTELSEQVKTSNLGETISSNLATADLNKQPDDDGQKNLFLKDSIGNMTSDNTSNKDKRECNMKNTEVKKRRRRIDKNTFRLIETIPYPSLLVVKDGDLCPSYTMTYDEKNYLPNCCHPLWRWRVGKPVKIPSQSSDRTKQDEHSKDDSQNNENDELLPIKLKENDVLGNENIDSDVLTVPILSEANCVQN